MPPKLSTQQLKAVRRVATLAARRDRLHNQYKESIDAVQRAVLDAEGVPAPNLALAAGWKNQTVRALRHWNKKELTPHNGVE